MFNELIESKPKIQRSPASAAFSVVLHTVLIVGAVYATSRADDIVEAVKDEKVEFVEEVKPKDEPPPPEEKAPPPPEVAAALPEARRWNRDGSSAGLAGRTRATRGPAAAASGR